MDDEEIENVVSICQAYNDGYNAGRMNMSIDNYYTHSSGEYYAFMFGHNVGMQAEFLEYEEGYLH